MLPSTDEFEMVIHFREKKSRKVFHSYIFPSVTSFVKDEEPQYAQNILNHFNDLMSDQIYQKRGTKVTLEFIAQLAPLPLADKPDNECTYVVYDYTNEQCKPNLDHILLPWSKAERMVMVKDWIDDQETRLSEIVREFGPKELRAYLDTVHPIKDEKVDASSFDEEDPEKDCECCTCCDCTCDAD